MNKKVVMVLSLLVCGVGVYAAANDEESRGRRKHRSERRVGKKNSEKAQKASFGNVTVQTIYNTAHHRVLFVAPDGKRTLIFPGESRQVAALFALTERKDPGLITTDDLENKHYLMNKGDHIYLFRHTPDGLTVHRVTDSKKVKKGRVLFPTDTKDAERDLLIGHVVTKSKTSAFSVHETGSLRQKDGHPKRSSVGALLKNK